MSAPVVKFDVWWEADPTKTREVIGWCQTCYPMGDDGGPVHLVSPQGLAHTASRGDMTDCGHDATGPEWWWQT